MDVTWWPTQTLDYVWHETMHVWFSVIDVEKQNIARTYFFIES